MNKHALFTSRLSPSHVLSSALRRDTCPRLQSHPLPALARPPSPLRWHRSSARRRIYIRPRFTMSSSVGRRSFVHRRVHLRSIVGAHPSILPSSPHRRRPFAHRHCFLIRPDSLHPSATSSVFH
ncbi:hypothetical protein BDN70DRAFT_703333 [Pholiota conissans]|uniref:Uncharacterized protein n=1 Tax=Pholiota conissans TaxID=109636 RepID=A0A9P5Z1M4_9AGAR|nr:hypothetical protein BDN70DRAFT_703333 [Pholiota conissans]